MTRSVVTRETGSMVKPSLTGGVSAVALGEGAAVSTADGSALAVSVVGSAVGLGVLLSAGAVVALLAVLASVSAGVAVVWLLPQPVSIRTQVASRALTGMNRADRGAKAMKKSTLWSKM